MKAKAYTLWLQWADGEWEEAITVSGELAFVTNRQVLVESRDRHYGGDEWKGHTRILPVGQKPK